MGCFLYLLELYLLSSNFKGKGNKKDQPPPLPKGGTIEENKKYN